MAAKTVSSYSCFSCRSLHTFYPGTVLLHLVSASLGRYAGSQAGSKPLSAVYIPVPSPFPQLESFIDSAAQAYNLDLFQCAHPTGPNFPVESVPTPGAQAAPIAERPTHVKGGEGMRVALQLYKNRFPNIEAILIGTRRSDPHGGECNINAPVHFWNLADEGGLYKAISSWFE